MYNWVWKEGKPTMWPNFKISTSNLSGHAQYWKIKGMGIGQSFIFLLWKRIYIYIIYILSCAFSEIVWELKLKRDG